MKWRNERAYDLSIETLGDDTDDGEPQKSGALLWAAIAVAVVFLCIVGAVVARVMR